MDRDLSVRWDGVAARPPGAAPPVDAGKANPQAIAIHLQSKTYVYDGTFGRPAALATTASFVRHPIPRTFGSKRPRARAVPTRWPSASRSSRAARPWGPSRRRGRWRRGSLGDRLLRVVRDAPRRELRTSRRRIDRASVRRCSGSEPGATAPSVVAGTSGSDAPAASGCRACHSVAAKGSELIVQDSVLAVRADVALRPANAGRNDDDAAAGVGLGGAFTGWRVRAQRRVGCMGTATDTQTELFRLTPPAATVVATALPSGVVGATPAFAPDGTRVAFTHVSGTVGTITGDGTHVVSLAFESRERDTLVAEERLHASPRGRRTASAFPSFMPTNDAVLVQLELAGCGTSSYKAYVGTGDVHGEIWWSDLATATQRRLDTLNGIKADGTSYLPTGANDHATTRSSTTSRRSIPRRRAATRGSSSRAAASTATSRRSIRSRAIRATTTTQHQATTKKLWVAAIDLNAPAAPTRAIRRSICRRRSSSRATRAASGCSIRADRTALHACSGTSAAAGSANRRAAAGRCARARRRRVPRTASNARRPRTAAIRVPNASTTSALCRFRADAPLEWRRVARIFAFGRKPGSRTPRASSAPVWAPGPPGRLRIRRGPSWIASRSNRDFRGAADSVVATRRRTGFARPPLWTAERTGDALTLRRQEVAYVLTLPPCVASRGSQDHLCGPLPALHCS